MMHNEKKNISFPDFTSTKALNLIIVVSVPKFSVAFLDYYDFLRHV